MAIRLITVCAASLLLQAHPAVAQPAQTPENAQKFLSMYLPTNFSLVYKGKAMKMRRASPVTWSQEFCTTEFKRVTEDSLIQDAGISWLSVIEVRHVSNSAIVVVTDTSHFHQTFDFQSPDLAARAAFAMEFLRQHCDPAAETGF